MPVAQELHLEKPLRNSMREEAMKGCLLLRISALAVVIFLLGSQTSHAQGTPLQPDLRVAVATVPHSGNLPTFEVELSNIANHDLVLNLGMMLANGHRQFADAIHLSLRDVDNNSEELDLIGPPFVAGRIDPFVVPLPRGARITLPVKLDDYWAPKQKIFEIKLGRGRYWLSAEYRGANPKIVNLDMKGIALMPYWVGRVSSREISFVVPPKDRN
jgi:hypothetical protein